MTKPYHFAERLHDLLVRLEGVAEPTVAVEVLVKSDARRVER